MELKFLSELFDDIKANKTEGSRYEDDYGDHVVVKKNVVMLDRVNEAGDFIQAVAVILPNGEMITNGDEEVNDTASSLQGFEVVLTLSFRCLSRFLNKKGEADSIKAAKYLASGKIKVLDSSDDHSVLYKESNVSPGNGYTLINKGGAYARWHRPASFLLEYNGHLIVMGQDENSYFGSEIPYDDKVNTVDKAFKALMPKSIRNRKDLKRQGEWFLVPVTEKQIPTAYQCVGGDEETVIWLPRDNDDSARHYIIGTDIRVFNNEVYAQHAEIRHEFDDHEVVSVEGWVKFVRNTAIRSYSEEGVD